MEYIKKRSSEFRGKERCNKYRKKTGYIFESEKNQTYDNAVLQKDIIRGWYKGEFKVNEFAELVDEGIEDNYETEETGKIKKKALVDVLQRYAMSESRKPTYLGKKKDIIMGNYQVSVSPDAVFDDGKVLEVVMIRTGKPSVSTQGRNKDTKAADSIELYSMILYGRELIPAGQSRQVEASYYFLRKNTDTKNNAWDFDFFSGSGGNVVSIMDEQYLGGSNSRTELDLHFDDIIKVYEEGEDICDEETCKTCPLYTACFYQKTPKPYEEKNIESKGTKKVYTDAQLEIINFRKGICRVNATAGSGKTECMTERGCRMIEEGIDPSEMLFITFTDAGALEMKERIMAKCKERGIIVSADDIKAKTFNAFAQEILQDNYEELGFTKRPEVADIDVVPPSVILTDLLDKTFIPGLDYKNFDADMPTLRGALACTKKVVDIMKSNDWSPDLQDVGEMVKEKLQQCGYYRFCPDSAIGNLINLYKEYDKILKSQNMIYYADQEPLMYKVFSLHPGYLDSYGFKHITVDEFQDSNTVQLNTIAKLIKCPSFESLMVVGDDSQSIYGFRNTTQENILYFFEKLGVEGKDLYLTENRRSDANILKLANKINDLNKEKVEKEMIPVREAVYKPFTRGFHTTDSEYNFIVENIARMINEKGYLAEDIAFIAATGNELMKMASKLSDAGIPWIMKNPIPLQENSRIQAAMALAEAFWQPEAENLYFTYLTALYDGEVLNIPIEELKAEIAGLRYQFEGMDNLEIPAQRALFHEKLEALRCNDEIYDYFLTLIYAQEDLVSELQYFHNFKKFGKNSKKKMEQSYAGVVLTTAHSSKGLEWKVVFNSLSGYDAPRLHNGRRSDKEREEKRRLLFVSMTRARDILALTGQFIAYGSAKEGYTFNQFLKEVIEANGLKYDPEDPLRTKKNIVKKYKPGKGVEYLSQTYEEDVVKEFIKEIEAAEHVNIYDFI